jgi:predicted DsbA family dithiol-disulfide isomerase
VEVEKLIREYEVEVQFAPYLLDPTTPSEGKPRRPQTTPDSPPSALELRGQRLGVKFSRGRTVTSNSHLALEAAEFATENERAWEFHSAMFKAYFDDLEDIGRPETVLRVAAEVGLDVNELRRAIEDRRYRQGVDEDIEWARSVGVTAVPTFVFDGRYAMVGAQEYDAFEHMIRQVGGRRRNGAG